MSIYIFYNFVIYCVINAFTPGPGNILAMNTVLSHGVKKGRPLFLGIFLGYYVVQLSCAILMYALNTTLPGLMEILKYIGAAYILWLTFHIVISKPSQSQDQVNVSLMKGFVLQLVNVKIYLFGISALTVYVVQYYQSLPMFIIFELLIATFGTVATLSWIWIGNAIQKFYIQHYRLINIVLGLTLLECVYSILKT
ncbi:LysE family transporter [Enterococcus columbae]|uniref:Cysteine/O-acetylserine efflux protein n=1 Tax=Enterococcus columbae DSM 7374 = ATCC 51263 TaxID=1121865 RepID=S1N649_9ENTE|nr:LysE family transporter [Enterococcus columbae]EOT44299.1 hypothetical protein OMW_00355 [Enterococcus columbae DSM 7374 = ATCC 51263]EOW84457.1 hypothetical protein I568_00953 [Enterococcus columbae DSM 7374 = ATCC 51263]